MSASGLADYTTASALKVQPYTPAGLAVVSAVGSSVYYISVPAGSITDSTAVITALLQRPDGVSENWIVDAQPYQGLTSGEWYIRVKFQASVGDPLTAISWEINAPSSTTGSATTTAP